MLILISASPSPYARKNHIVMLEKGIPFQLQTEIPWHSDTKTPQYNPLEKLPKYKGTGPDLIPASLDDQLLAKQIQVIADGACDAMGLVFFENARGELKSAEWHARQDRKVNGVLKAMNELVIKANGKYLVDNEFSIADVAAGAMLGMMNMVETNFGIIAWKAQYPELVKYWEMLESRPSFKETQPYMFDLTEKVA